MARTQRGCVFGIARVSPTLSLAVFCINGGGGGVRVGLLTNTYCYIMHIHIDALNTHDFLDKHLYITIIVQTSLVINHYHDYIITLHIYQLHHNTVSD